MAPYHHMLAHFPVALLSIALLIVLFRGFSDSELAKRLDHMLPYVLVIGLLGGVATFISGLLVWPMEAAISTPMGRNKILIAAWMLACWTVVLALRLKGGESVWKPGSKWIMVAMGALGGILVATTGTLGGHLLGSPSRLSGGLRALGWDVYHTYYAPGWVLAVMIALAIVAIVVGVGSARARHSSVAPLGSAQGAFNR